MSLFEQRAAESTIVALHQLCATCSRFRDGSRLLRKMFRMEKMKINEKEYLDLGSPADLKSGYLTGCHLCAQLWIQAGGDLFDPVDPKIQADKIRVRVKARNFEKEYEMETETSKYQNWCWKLAPPSIGELGVITIGIPDVWAHQSQSIGESGFKWRELFVYPTSNTELNPAILKQNPEPISSKHDIKLEELKSWYHECAEKHTKCTSFSNMVAPDGQLPTRLLHLQNDKVRLVCNPQSESNIKYTTLSHMWGPDPTACLRLMEAQLEEFTSDIPVCQLPAKYLEAIRITKALGFEYIWIDSLCIIQDSAKDWENEALKMASVYGRTACNISYVYPPSDDSNKSHLRDPRAGIPCQLSSPKSRKTDQGDRIRLVVQNAPGFLTRHWSPDLFKAEWPLLSRAWVFQERLLCPRNLYYGPSRLMWECCEGLKDEFVGPLTNSPRSKSRFYAVFSGIEDVNGGRDLDESFKGQWHLLVQDYRLANLTFEKDRVIALAGVVKAIQSQTKYTYLAGIWKEFAEFDLLWNISPPTPLGDFRKATDKAGLQAPSWSWFTVPPQPSSTPFGSNTIDFRIARQMYARHLFTVYKAHITSFRHPHAASGSALLHDFAGLNITLRARRIPCTLEWDEEVLRLLPHGRYVTGHSYQLEPKNAMKYVHDDVALEPGSSVPSGVCMLLTMLEAWTVYDKRDHRYDSSKFSDNANYPGAKTQWQFAGLVVAPVLDSSSGYDSWQRIGVFVFDDFLPGLNEFEIPFTISEEEDLILV